MGTFIHFDIYICSPGIKCPSIWDEVCSNFERMYKFEASKGVFTCSAIDVTNMLLVEVLINC